MLGDDSLAQRLEPQSLGRPDEPFIALEERAQEPLVGRGEPLRQPALERREERPPRRVPANEHERVVGDADERRRENRRQCDVVVAVVQEPQVGEEVDDLLLAEIAAAGRAIGRQALAPQRFLVALCVRARGEEDDDLAGVGLAGVHELAHATRDPLRLARTPVLIGLRRSSPCP